MKAGIIQLPSVAKLGVYTAYSYYFRAFGNSKQSSKPETRVRVNNFMKTYLFCKSYLKVKFNLFEILFYMAVVRTNRYY